MPGGRPKAVIDYPLVEKLGQIQCTQEEIANILNISVRTLQRDEEFCRIYKKGYRVREDVVTTFSMGSSKKGTEL